MNDRLKDAIASAYADAYRCDYTTGVIDGFVMALNDVLSAVLGEDVATLSVNNEPADSDVDTTLCTALGLAVARLAETDEPQVPMSEYRRVFEAMQGLKAEMDNQRRVMNLPPVCVGR